MTKRRWTLLGAVVALAAVVAASAPPPAPPAPAPYLDPVFHDITQTPPAQPLTFGSAPPFDPTVGPRRPARPPARRRRERDPAHVRGRPVDNTAANRPAIVWIHGGGFKAGIGSSANLLANVGVPYAERGYVGFSIEYRVNTTSDCQYVQDHQADVPQPPDWLEKYLYARRRSSARNTTRRQPFAGSGATPPSTGSTPTRSRWPGSPPARSRRRTSPTGGTTPATTPTSPTTTRRANSRVQGVLAASGCEYQPESIGAGDAPAPYIHSEFDLAVDYRNCVVPTVTQARAAGLVAELTSYCDQNGHAANLYQMHKAETDAQWTTFLARELRIYSGMRPPSADPVCP